MTGGSEHGQSSIEALLVVPLCVVCALALAEVGVLVRDRMAVADAASRAAVAAVHGDDAPGAARRALPKSLRGRARVESRDGTIVVSAEPRLGLLGAVSNVRVSSTVSVEGGAS